MTALVFGSRLPVGSSARITLGPYEALALSPVAFDATMTRAARALEGVGEHLLGECLSVDDPVAAAAHLARAREILETCGARNELAKTLVAQAELAAAAGRHAEARDLLQRALEIFDAIGTLDGPDRARRVLASLANA